MGLQVDAVLNSECYFPGDALQCKITLFTKTQVAHLDWISVQIVGNYVVEPSWIKLPPVKQNSPAFVETSTALSDPIEELGV
jgi:hypothetical protein